MAPVEIFFDELYLLISQSLDLRGRFSLARTDKAKWALLGENVMKEAAPLRKLAQLQSYRSLLIEGYVDRMRDAANGWKDFSAGLLSRSAVKKARKLIREQDPRIQSLQMTAHEKSKKNTYLAALSALAAPDSKIEFLHLTLDTAWTDRDILKALGKLLARKETRIFLRLEFTTQHSEKLYRLLERREGPTHLEFMFDWNRLPEECRRPCLALAKSGHLHGLHVQTGAVDIVRRATPEAYEQGWLPFHTTQGIAHLSLRWTAYLCSRSTIIRLIDRPGLQSLVLMPNTQLSGMEWEDFISAIFRQKNLAMARVVDYTWKGTPSVCHLLKEPAKTENNLCLEIGTYVEDWQHLLGLLKPHSHLTMLCLNNIGELDKASDAALADFMRQHPLQELHIYSSCVLNPRTLREHHRHLLTALLDMPREKKFFIHCPDNAIVDVKFVNYWQPGQPGRISRSFCFRGGWHAGPEISTKKEWYLNWLAK